MLFSFIRNYISCSLNYLFVDTILDVASGWPLITLLWFVPANAPHYGQWFFWPNVVATNQLLANGPLFDSGWPLLDFWLISTSGSVQGLFWSKFGSHRTFPSNLLSDRPPMTPARPLTSEIFYTLVRDFYDQICEQRIF